MVYPPPEGGEGQPDLDVLYLSKNPDAICRGRRQHMWGECVPHIDKSNTKRRCWKGWREIIPSGGDEK